MKRNAIWIVAILLIASPVLAATYTWNDTAADGAAWTNNTSWSGGTAPGAGGGHDIVLTNNAAATRNSWIYENWTINSLSFGGGSGSHYINAGGANKLNIGAGGISANRGSTERWLLFYAPVTFTAANVSIRTNSGASWASIDFVNTIDSSAVGGTTAKIITGFNGGYARFSVGSKSTANMNWILENSRIAIYTANPTDALGSNTLKVAWSEGARTAGRSTTLGLYGNQNAFSVKDAAYFDTPIEFDPYSVGTDGGSSLRSVTLISQRLRNDGGVVTNYFRGKWTTKNGVTITNGSGNGVFQISGASDAAGVLFGQQVSMYDMDASGVPVLAIASPSWNGDVAINDGYHVVKGAHAFGTNNTWSVNLTSSAGTVTTIRARQFFLADGVTYNGVVRNYGGNHTLTGGSTVIRGQGWLGVHGTGTATYSNAIWLFGNAPVGSFQKIYDLVLYATNNSRAIFTGNFVTNTWGGENPNVYVTGGGTIEMSGHGRYLGNTTVQSNTTLRLDGTLNTAILTVESGSRLQGGGTITNDLVVSGTVAPGNSPGTLTVRDDATLNSGSFFEVDLSVLDNTSDVLNVLDLLTAGGTLKLIGGKAQTTYTIANYGSLSGTFASIDTTGLGSGLSLETGKGYEEGIKYGDGSGDSITLTVIPEPASVLLMVSGLVAAWKLRRRA